MPKKIISRDPRSVARAAVLEYPATKAALEAIAASKKLDKEFLALVANPIYNVWNDIAYDAGRCSNAGAVELCIDADRLWFFGPGDVTNSRFVKAVVADAAVGAAIEKHGYTKVLRYLSRNLSLT